jgi:cytochrome c oxidase assembly protein subunit 15
LLTLAFGTTVAVWAVAYLCRMPPVWAPNWLLLLLILLCLFLGGLATGKGTDRGLGGGIAVGGISSLINLLVLGSVLSGEAPNQLRPSAVAWVPGALLVGMALGGAGAALGSRLRPCALCARIREGGLGWTAAFAMVGAVATLLLLAAGGLVTSTEAGLAVVDWPNSYGYNMFLYPLARMSGGIYYEHAHRLFGTLVGLCALVLALHLQFGAARRRLKALGWIALLLVIVQGILGGLRVTGGFTMSQSAAAMRPSTALALVHGVLGQVYFAFLLGIAAQCSRRWRDAVPEPRESAASEAQLSATLVALLMIQLVLGAWLRHFGSGTLVHISFAMIVALVAVAVGVRAWGFHAAQPVLRRAGKALTILIGLQLLLGTGALIAVGNSPEAGDIPVAEILLATAHQITGALLLGLAVLMALWSRRLLRAPERGGEMG